MCLADPSLAPDAACAELQRLHDEVTVRVLVLGGAVWDWLAVTQLSASTTNHGLLSACISRCAVMYLDACAPARWGFS